MQRSRSIIIGASIAILAFAGFALHGESQGAQTLVHGLTMASIVFLVAAGLSLIFGLMNVLNLAHGAMFMLGSYVAAVASDKPGLLSIIVAYPLALAAGAIGGGYLSVHAWPKVLNRVPKAVGWAVALVGFGVAGLLWLAGTPTSLPVDVMEDIALSHPVSITVIALTSCLGAYGVRLTRESRREVRRGRSLLIALSLLVGALVLVIGSEWIDETVLGLPGNVVFILAVLMGTAVGAGVGGVMETGLLRKLYSRHLTQVIMTFFILIFMVQAVQVIFGRNSLTMSRPDAMDSSAANCEGAGIFDALANSCASVSILGAQTATYRLVIIASAVAVAVALGALMRYSKSGMYIKAGVQNSEMLSALGVDVRRVFSRTFVLGSAIAAFGGAIAAPFLGATPSVALIFLVDATIVLLIGGLGSIGGAVIGALVLGLYTSLSDITVLQAGFDPAFTRVSVLVLFVVILLARPNGLFGKVRL